MGDFTTHKMVLEGLFGPVHRLVTTKELIDSKHLAKFSIKCLALKYPESVCKEAKTFDYLQEINFLISNSSRNTFLSKLALSLKGNTLILYQFVDKHGKILYNEICERAPAGRKVFIVHGKIEAIEREEIRKIVEKETDAIIVASYGTFQTGINIRNLHNIIFASPAKGRIRTLQSIGRGLRQGSNKDAAVLYDIVDDLRYKKHKNFGVKHFLIRTQFYNEEHFPYKLYEVELK